jgi:hypothetical protein
LSVWALEALDCRNLGIDHTSAVSLSLHCHRDCISGQLHPKGAWRQSFTHLLHGSLDGVVFSFVPGLVPRATRVDPSILGAHARCDCSEQALLWSKSNVNRSTPVHRMVGCGAVSLESPWIDIGCGSRRDVQNCKGGWLVVLNLFIIMS